MAKLNRAPNSVWTDPIHFLAFGFGSGAMPYAPGTFGTLVAVPICIMLAPLDRLSFMVVTLILFVLGIWICGRTSRDLGVHDHGGIVWDEIVGYLCTMALVTPTMVNLLIGFLLFRVLDIVKPWPIGWLDRRISGGIGIMLDDILAGAIGMVLLYAFNYYKLL